MEQKNFNRIQSLFLKKAQSDLKFKALCCFSSLGQFIDGGGAELMVKKGFESYHKAARGYWRLYKGEEQKRELPTFRRALL